jgi:hypothetical protein
MPELRLRQNAKDLLFFEFILLNDFYSKFSFRVACPTYGHSSGVRVKKMYGLVKN